MQFNSSPPTFFTQPPPGTISRPSQAGRNLPYTDTGCALSDICLRCWPHQCVHEMTRVRSSSCVTAAWAWILLPGSWSSRSAALVSRTLFPCWPPPDGVGGRQIHRRLRGCRGA